MNIKGLDYNTQREQLILPEYGREIQEMVNHCLTLENKKQRQICAENIVATMSKITNKSRKNINQQRKFWDHLAILSNFQLDIDYPFDIETARKLSAAPNSIDYPAAKIPVRHYGNILSKVFEQLKHMPPSKERDELVKKTANQMKRNLTTFGHGSNDGKRVAADLETLTDGNIRLDLTHFKFEKIVETPVTKKNKRKK